MQSMLTLSSAAFILVALLALYKRLYIYSLCWLVLCITSIAFHEFGVLQAVDKIAVYIVVFVGLFYYIQLVQSNVHIFIKLVPLMFFIICIVAYYKTTLEHIYIHLSSIIGHSIIIFFV